MANVMVVDDEPMVLDLLSNLLEKLRHKVWRAANAAEALGLLWGPGHFDLLITDLVMPGMSGIELARQIRGTHPAMAMVVISGYLCENSTHTIESIRALGITEILHKPIDPLSFEMAVHNALRYHR